MKTILTNSHNEKIADHWLNTLEDLSQNTFSDEDPREIAFLNIFMGHFLHLFTQRDFVPSDQQLLRFIDYNSSIANLAAISEFRTTDSYVEKLQRQDASASLVSIAKLLALYSPRNWVHIESRILFDADPVLASRWYYAYLAGFNSGCASEHSLNRLREALEYRDERLVLAAPSKQSANTYFGSTYVDHQNAHHLKRHINLLYRACRPSALQIVNKPNPRRIGVFTGKWVADHVVHRATQPFLKELAKNFELTLVHLGKWHPRIDRSLFDEVKHFDLSSEVPNWHVITPNDFVVALFPDIGMNMESIYLSNMRLASIQVTSCGHPESTWGSEIDYFINGTDVEVPELAAQHYSERLVLIPGCGQISTRPRYEPKGIEPNEDTLRIACCWNSQKINYPHLLRLHAACIEASQPVRFVFFPQPTPLSCGFLPVVRDIIDVLGAEHVEVNPMLEYHKYMELIEGCHFAVDAYPFGGFSTAVDLLWVRKPLVVLRGNRSYNRSAAYLLERMGLGDMVADDEEDFVALLARMISDVEFRKAAIERARAANAVEALLSQEHAIHFSKAIHYLLENHNRLREGDRRAPIFIAN